MINDVVISQGAQRANQILGQQLRQVAEMFQSAEKVVQAKTPPPQLPPEVQSAVQIAKMDTDRKTALDKATFGLKQQDGQLKQQMESARLQMEKQQQQFEQMLEKSSTDTKALQGHLDAQLQLIKNKQDNDQHQLTELLKNNQDNQTAIIIEKMKELGAANAAPPDSGPAPGTSTDTLQPLLQALEQHTTTLNDFHNTMKAAMPAAGPTEHKLVIENKP